jgi:hypothetical protein
MPDYTVKADVDSMLRADNDAGIRSAIGLGQTDAPTFAGTSIQSQTDGAHTFKVRNIAGADLITINTSTRNVTLAGDAFNFSTSTGNFSSYNAGAIAWSDGSTATGGTLDLFIRRDAAGILAQRNGTNAQAFRVYNTYTDASNYQRLSFGFASGVAQILSSGAGTSGHAALTLGTGTGTWQFTTAGNFIALADNTFDIGASGANRPRDVYAGGNGIFGGVVSAAFGFRAPSSSQIIASSDGIWRLTNSSVNDFNRLQFGSTTDAFPAIARDGAGIKFTGAAAGSTSWIKVPAVAVSALPSASTAGAGARSFVNDALTPVFGSAVTGGGAVTVPVYSTGSAWNVG